MSRASIDSATTMLTMLLLIYRDFDRLFLLLLLLVFAYRRFLLMILLRLLWQLRHSPLPDWQFKITEIGGEASVREVNENAYQSIQISYLYT